MKIMDINDIKANAGVVFNKLDPRFDSVVENHINNNRKRLLNGIKNSPADCGAAKLILLSYQKRMFCSVLGSKKCITLPSKVT
mgnify:CR=1 FL=1